MRPFSEYKVVEIGSRIGSAYCGKLLSDYGATVFLIESPDGNPLRTHGPFKGQADKEKSGLFGYLHAGKKSVVIEPEDRAELEQLVASADVLVFGASDDPHHEEQDFFNALGDLNGSLISVHISPYGRSGPYAGYAGNELTAAALSGIHRRIGSPSRAPLTLPLVQAGYQAGYAGASGVGCALLSRSGRTKQVIEVSEAEVLATVHIGYAVTRFQRAGILETRAGHRLENLPYPQTVLPCADGYVELNTPEGRQWGRLLEMIGSPEWSKDERYASRTKNNRGERADELDDLFRSWLKNHTKDEFFALCREFEVPSGPVRTVDEVFRDEQLKWRNFFTEIEFPDGEKVAVPGSGCGMTGTPARTGSIVPALGAHNGERPKASSVNGAGGSDPSGAGKQKPSRGPLDGYRILDLGWVWAGALPGQILADMGAEVIKVESLKRIDYMRLGRPLVGDKPDPEQNPWFHAVNRNKKSITVNLKTEAGVDLIKRLALECDAVIENFKPGFLPKIGLDYDTLSKSDPSLVMLSMSGVGQTGPMSNIPAYAPLLAGLSGLDSVVGYPGEGILGVQQPYADTNAGVCAAFALISALLHKQRTGQGQHIDLAESEAAIAVLGEAFVHYSMTGEVERPQGNDRYGYAPHGHYPTSGEDSWIAIAVSTDRQWRSLCKALGSDQLANNPLFATPADRWENRRALDRALSGIAAEQDGQALFRSLQENGVAAMPLKGPKEIVEDPHFNARGTFVELTHPVLGDELIYGPMWRMEGNSTGHWRHAPILGEHTAEIMTGILGLTPGEIDDLVEREVLV